MDTTRKAIVYVRVSTTHQLDNYSVEDQRDLKRLGPKYGFSQVEVREEQGVSGESLTGRPVMMGILQEIADGKVGAIIVSSFTRLSRDMDGIDGRLVKKACRDNDVVIITPEKLYDFSKDTDDDLADLQFLFAKIQKRMNLKPMMRGEYLKAKRGGFVGRRLSFGYDLEWKEVETPKGRKLKADLVINPEEAEVVRFIHETYPKTFFRQTAIILNEKAARGEVMYYPIKDKRSQRFHGSTHRPWTEQDVRQIIKNKLVIGRLTYTPRSKLFGDAEPIVAYRPDLRIIDDATFERNQRIMEQRRKLNPRVRGSHYAFSGLLRCPKCGAKMHGRGVKKDQRNKDGYRYKQYCCSNYNKSGKAVCEGYSITETVAFKVVLPMLKELIHKNLRPHFEEVARTRASESAEKDIVGMLRAEIERIERQIENLLAYAQEGAITAEQLRKQNFRLLEKKGRLEERLADLESKRETEEELYEILRAFEEDFDRILEDLSQDPKRFNILMRTFFDELTIVATLRGRGWRKGYRKGMPLPEEKGRIVSFRLNPMFEAYVEAEGIGLPEALRGAEWRKFTEQAEVGRRSIRRGRGSWRPRA